MGIFAGRQKVDLDELQTLLDKKIIKSDIAKKMGVNPSSITRAIKRMNEVTSRVMTMEKGRRLADHAFNFMTQQERNVRVLNELLDGVLKYIGGDSTVFKAMQRKIETKSVEQPEGSEGKKGKGGGGKKVRGEVRIETFDFSTDPKLLVVQVIREVREHMDLHLRVMATLANAENILNFQKHVIEIIGEVDPACRQKIIDRLRAEHAIRAGLIVG
jgi:hypothetical protein